MEDEIRNNKHFVRLMRTLNYIVIILYPLMGYIRAYRFPFEQQDYQGRWLISALFAFILSLSYFKSLKKYYHSLLSTAAFIFIFHTFYVAYLNDMAPMYAYSTYYIVFAVSVILQSHRALLLFFFTTMTLAFSVSSMIPLFDIRTYLTSLTIVQAIAYTSFIFRRKLVFQAFHGQKVQKIINRLMELLLLELSFEKTLNQTIQTLSDAPWIKSDSPIAIYLTTGEKIQFVADNGYFNRLPFKSLNRSKYDFTIIGDSEETLGILVIGKPEQEPAMSHEDRLSYSQSIADTIALLIRRHQKEKIIRKQQAQLTQSAKMVALGEMAGGVAHEINTPLAIINGITFNIKELQKLEKLNEGNLTASLIKIEATVSRIADIVYGLRSFSQEGRINKFKTHKIGDIVKETVSLCREKFRSYGVSLEIPIENLELSVECRKTEITQVLINLLNNSFDAIFDQSKKEIKLTIEDHDEELVICIKDSGSGVIEKNRSKLFDPFFTTKSIGKGTGLGLSISKGIIDRHQGELYLDDDDPAKFVVKLPKRQNSNLEIKKVS